MAELKENASENKLIGETIDVSDVPIHRADNRSDNIVDNIAKVNEQLVIFNYQFLSSLYYAAPSTQMKQIFADMVVTGIDSNDPLLNAWADLGVLFDQRTPEQLTQEHQDLFIGIGQGEVIPFACYYLDGHLMGHTLIAIRKKLDEYGIVRDPLIHEPEDHLSLLCLTMMTLLQDKQNPEASQFFEQFIFSWVIHFCDDLKKAPSAVFYKQLAEVTQIFMTQIQATRYD